MINDTGTSRKRQLTMRRVAAACMIGVGAVVVIGGLAAASNASHSTNPSAQLPAVASSTSKLVVSTLKTSRYGTILVSGKTVYTLKPSSVACTAACTKIWPRVLLPVGVAKATAGKGVNAASLGTVKIAGGRLQVTYAHKALYWFTGDKSAGQVTGVLSDKWGKWTVYVTVKPSSPPPTTTTTSGGGGIGF